MIVYDLETGPETDEVLQELYEPLDANSVPLPENPGKFDPKTVAYGNTKDEAKRAAKLAECEAKHAALVTTYESAIENREQTVAQAQSEHYLKFVEKAALSGLTGRLLAFGHRKDIDGPTRGIGHLDEFANEAAFVKEVWEFMKSYKSPKKAGFNTHGFDLPFLILRSYRLGVAIPPWVRDTRGYFHDTFIDLAKLWDFPRMHYPFANSKLDTVARLLNVGRKTDGMCGGDFHEKYFGTSEDRKEAFAYLDNDLDITWDCAVVMQVM